MTIPLQNVGKFNKIFNTLNRLNTTVLLLIPSKEILLGDLEIISKLLKMNF